MANRLMIATRDCHLVEGDNSYLGFSGRAFSLLLELELWIMASPARTHCLHCLTIEAKHSPTVEALSARPPTICPPPPPHPRSQ